MVSDTNFEAAGNNKQMMPERNWCLTAFPQTPLALPEGAV